MLWFLIAVGVLVVVLSVRDLLRRPDPTSEPDPRQPVPRGGDHTDWARAWDGPNGPGPRGGTDGGGSGPR